METKILDLSTYFPHLEEFEHRALFDGISYPWEAVKRLGNYLEKAISSARSALQSGRPDGIELQNRVLGSAETILVVRGLVEVQEAILVEGADVILGAGVVLEPGALIKAPAYIGAGTEVRQGAYLRGDVLVGEGCTIGHATEVKNSVFMDHTEAGHFAYVGDSILGSYVNLGAGTKLANLQLRRSADKLAGTFPPLTLRFGSERLTTDMSKFGAVLGDYCETGCNSVTAPGVFCGAHCWISANRTILKGYYPPRTVLR